MWGGVGRSMKGRCEGRCGEEVENSVHPHTHTHPQIPPHLHTHTHLHTHARPQTHTLLRCEPQMFSLGRPMAVRSRQTSPMKLILEMKVLNMTLQPSWKR